MIVGGPHELPDVMSMACRLLPSLVNFAGQFQFDFPRPRICYTVKRERTVHLTADSPQPERRNMLREHSRNLLHHRFTLNLNLAPSLLIKIILLRKGQTGLDASSRVVQGKGTTLTEYFEVFF